MDVSGGCEWQIDGAEQEVRNGQGDDKHRRGVGSQLLALEQGHNSEQIT